jgi:hypothetical protein
VFGGGARCNGLPIRVAPTTQLAQALWCFETPTWFRSQGLGGELGTSGTTQVTISAPPVDRTSSATLVSTTPLAVPTTAISAATAVTVFELRLTDNDANADGIPNGGSSDGQSTLVNGISVSLTSPGSAYLAYQLRGPDLSAPVAGTLSSNGTSLQFDLSATPLSIANNSSETYSVEAWYASGRVVAKLLYFSGSDIRHGDVSPYVVWSVHVSVAAQLLEQPLK